MGALRVGLIGLGSMGRHHARVIRATPGMELVAVADPGGDRFGVADGLPVLSDVRALIDAGAAGITDLHASKSPHPSPHAGPGPAAAASDAPGGTSLGAAR